MSGRAQHAVGMRGPKLVVEVNFDGDSPAITDADHQVVADLHDIVPALVAGIGVLHARDRHGT